jgi:hypothetical protein
MRRFLLFLVCLFSFVFVGCKAKELISHAAISHDVQSRGVTDVIKTASEEKYSAPADGHLTGTQIENFIKIRQRAKVIEDVAHREIVERGKKPGQDVSLTDVMQAAQSAALLSTADVRASQELGFNSTEYEWVKQQVIDASSAAVADQNLAGGQKLAAAERADLQQHLDDAPDENSKKTYAGLIADSEKNQKDAEAAVEPQSATVIYNKELLAKYEDAGRPLMELMLSGTGHEEEIQKAMSETKKVLEGAPKAP